MVVVFAVAVVVVAAVAVTAAAVVFVEADTAVSALVCAWDYTRGTI